MFEMVGNNICSQSISFFYTLEEHVNKCSATFKQDLGPVEVGESGWWGTVNRVTKPWQHVCLSNVSRGRIGF